MEAETCRGRRRDPPVGAARRGAGAGLTAVVCLAALVAIVIAGRVILVEFFPSIALLMGLGR